MLKLLLQRDIRNSDPSQEEQDEVANYVLKRPLLRPNTSYKKAGLYIFGYITLNVVFILTIINLLYFLLENEILPEIIIVFFYNHNFASIVLVTITVLFISGCIVLKPAVIGAIHLYQKYAPERIRRKCLFKPTCSEYTILAVKKYGVIFGLIKSYNRLFIRCKGRIYMIDEP